jgi:hypothetical protein
MVSNKTPHPPHPTIQRIQAGWRLKIALITEIRRRALQQHQSQQTIVEDLLEAGLALRPATAANTTIDIEVRA